MVGDRVDLTVNRELGAGELLVGGDGFLNWADRGSQIRLQAVLEALGRFAGAFES